MEGTVYLHLVKKFEGHYLFQGYTWMHLPLGDEFPHPLHFLNEGMPTGMFAPIPIWGKQQGAFLGRSRGSGRPSLAHSHKVEDWTSPRMKYKNNYY